MKLFLQLITAIFIVASARAELPKKNTEFDGSIKAITESSITVESPKGTRVFAIYPGTVFGQRAAKKLSDFTVGEKVHVVFSEVRGKAQAENIRNPEEDKKPGAKKKKRKNK